MSDLISRQAIIDAIQKLNIPEDMCVFEIISHIEVAIATLPSAENNGEWIAQDIHNCHTNFKCSECGYIHSFMHLYGEPTADYPYCPNCGARMKGGET